MTPRRALEDSEIFLPATHFSVVIPSVLQSKQKSFVAWLFNTLD
jgi:hypothetical protein